MRIIALASLALVVLMGGLLACNSNESMLAQAPKSSPTPQDPAKPPADDARRIKADELHDLWVKKDVLIIDTRSEDAYKAEHITGAISMPTGTVLDRVDELPRNKLIAAYCT
jgi:3-mercaptopyruvate sulfurtransferase SseA